MHNFKSIKYFIICLFIINLQSCSKDSGPVNTEETEAIVKISSVNFEYEEGPSLMAKNIPSGIQDNNVINDIIPFGKGKTIEVSLQPAEVDQPQSSTIKKVAALVTSPLQTNVRYKLLIYDNLGKFITEKEYIYGNEAKIAGIPLDAGKDYTFVAYSINSTTDLPAIVGKEDIKTANLSNVSADLMFFKKTMKISFGTINLGIILKHQFSMITTKLTIDPNTTGTITNVTNAAISPSRISANLSFNDQKITYNQANTTGLVINFPTIPTQGQRIVTSNPTLVINPSTNTGSVTIGSLTIDGDTKTNITIPNVKILPGVKYNLVLNFKTCTQDVSTQTALNWDYPQVTKDGQNGIEKNGVFIRNGGVLDQTIVAPGADYGFVFDITKMDNSFNMELNGVKLAKTEIQFQKGLTIGQNIRFVDGSTYEGTNSAGGTIGAVYNFTGTATSPIVKVVISKTGEVTMYGSKYGGGPLLPLELFNGNSFNNFKWNAGGQESNTVKITQIVQGRTIIRGVGTGKSKISCN